MTDTFTPKYEFESNTFSFIKIDDFRKFLVDNKLIVSIVSFTVAYYIKEVIDSFFDNILFCKETDLFNTYSYCFFNIKIKLGVFIKDILKFFISLIIVFYLARFLNDIIN